MDIDCRNLHPLEIKLLRHVKNAEDITTSRLEDELGYNIGQCNQVFSWLSMKGLISEKERKTKVSFVITDFGKNIQKIGLPVERIFNFIKEKGSETITGLCEKLGLENSDVGSAFGFLSKHGVTKMNDEKKAEIVKDEMPSEVSLQRSLLNRGASGEEIEEESLSEEEKNAISSLSKKRGALFSPFKRIEREDVVYTLTEDGVKAKTTLEKENITGEELGILTPELLQSGEWKEKGFRPYGINTPPSHLTPGRRNPYGEYLEWVKNKLISLGFEEFDGPLVENEFWNGDALFMPQFHSARDIHDVYYVKTPTHAKKIDEPWLSNVARTHEDGGATGSRGWGYKFDHEFTRRQVLRSQGTVLSAHQLTKAKVPGKYFGIVRCFRYDQVDATHGADFYQTEGIVLGEDVNLKTLLGLLKMFAEEIAGAEEIKYVPGYFPFTEPSIEVHIKHPVLGWFELGGAGIFRPEVTKPLGVDVPVLAWGLGIDRMALMHLGLNDLRELFSVNIDSVRTRRGN